MFKIRFFCLVLSFFAQCVSTSGTDFKIFNTTSPIGDRVQFQLQPYKGTLITWNGSPISLKLIENDKSIGTIQLDFSALNRGGELAFNNPHFNPKRISLSNRNSLHGQLIALDKIGLNHSFVIRYKTGLQPKSVRFIDQTRLAISLLEDDGMDILDIRNGNTIRVRPPEAYRKKLGFVETLAIPEFDELWVSQMHANAVHVFDLKTLSFKTTVNLTGKLSKILIYDKKRDLVYCSNWITEDISIIDRKTKRELKKTGKVGLPRGLYLSPNGDDLYIAQFSASNHESEGGRIAVYSLHDEKISRTIGAPGNKRHIVSSLDLKKLYVSDMCCSKIEVFDEEKKILKKNIIVFDKPNTIALSADGKYLYVSCRGPNHPVEGYLKKGLELGRIYVIDTSTDAVLEYWEAGNQPTGLDVSPDGKYIATTDFLDHQVRIYKRN